MPPFQERSDTSLVADVEAVANSHPKSGSEMQIMPGLLLIPHPVGRFSRLQEVEPACKGLGSTKRPHQNHHNFMIA